jgi:predicted Zn-dependent peptidase
MKSKFYRKVLKNGMVVMLEKRDLPVVSVAFAIKSGSRNEDEKEKGISHFIEHMLYKGTPSRSQFKIAEEIEKNGGELNGFTSETITAYWCKMPSSKLNIALDVLSDIVKNPLLDEKELEKERKIIFEEIKMRKDSPMVYVVDKIKSELYSGPFGMDISGTVETMGGITRNKMLAIFKEFYAPDNMMLCVVGDADFDKLVQFAEKNFGKVKSKKKIPKIKLQNQSRVEKRKGIDQANLVFGYHIPTSEDDKNYAAQALSTLMAGGMSSRLFVEIREKRNLAYGIKGEADVDKDFAYALVLVGTMKENVEKVKGLIIEEFEKVSKGLTEKELKEVKGQMLGNYKISMEDSRGQMAGLLFYEVLGNAKEFYDFEKKIKAVKLKDVKDLAKKAAESYSFFALVPED